MVLEPQPDLPHSHCDNCHNQYCGKSPEPHVACTIVNCELDCGSKYHVCKSDEHKLLCKNEKVPCINAVYGCPMSVLRCHISRHLAVCPASVIHCTMEWNRWPVCSAERQSHQPMQLSPDFNCNQLDIALALRDQRMLTKSMRASKRTRQILTNTLNRRHPAVPLSEALTSDKKEGFDDQKELQNLLTSMHEWEQEAEKKRSRTPPGLERSICGELHKATKETTESLAAVIKTQYPRYPYIHCAHCEKRKARMERLMASHEVMKEKSDDGALAEDDQEQHIHVEGEAMDHECTDGAKAMDATSTQMADPEPEQPCTHANPSQDDHKHHDNHSHHDDTCQHDDHMHGSDYLRLPRSPLPSTSSDDDFEKPSLFVTPSTTGEVSAAKLRDHTKTLIVHPPNKAAGGEPLPQLAGGVSPTSGQPLSLDLSLESITRYQAKPDSMYTFLCAQEFRRDEFPYHFQNVHSDIHGGLNGWLEQRCPLAPYGCTYSQRRFHPGSHGARIIHSEGLESFGIVLGDEKDAKSDSSTSSRSPKHKYVPLLTVDKTVTQTVADNESSTNTSSAEGTQPMEEGAIAVESEESAMTDSKTSPPSTSKSDRPHSIPISSGAIQKSSNQSNDIDTDTDPKNSQSNDSDMNMGVETPPTPVPQLCNSQSVPSPTKSSQSEEGVDYLSELPLELQRYLTKFLDGFSMCNLAMTSKLIRQVCCSMLEERGMVILQWEKRRGHWDVAYKVWHFSTAFSPVLNWGFEDQPSMAMHLRACPYNVKLHQTEPVRVMAQNAEPIGLRADAQERNLGWAFARN